MKIRFASAVAAPVVAMIAVLGVLAGPALGDSAADIVKKRQETMKQLGANMKAITEFVKTGQGSAGDVAARAGQIAATAKLIPSLFPAGTGMDMVTDPKTGAKPEIWVDFTKFEAAAANLGDLAGKLQQAAAGGDAPAIGAALAPVGKEGCGGCHTPFRQKLDN